MSTPEYREGKLQEEIDRLARLCEAKDAEIEIMKAESSISDQLLSEANAMIAMQAEALAHANSQSYPFGHLDMFEKALSATAETVAAWRAKETEPLRREVAMLREGLDIGADDYWRTLHGNQKYFSDTQATALAYEREVKAKALEEAARHIKQNWSTSDADAYGAVREITEELFDMAAELRANKGEVK